MINKQSSVTLIQRQTVDWMALSDNEFRKQSIIFSKLWGKPEDYVWQLFLLWNKTFSIDYRSIRQRLKNMSLSNYYQAADVSFIPYQQYKNIPSISGYYIFLDDDDWVAPNLIGQLSNKLLVEGGRPPLLLWRSANIGSPQQEHVVFIWGMNGRCMTNNYAVHSDWLQPFSNIDKVIQHKDAENIFSSNKNIPHFDCALTVSNKSPISSVSLDRGLAGAFSPDKLKQLVESYVRRMESVKDEELVYLPWVKEYLQKTKDIFKELL